MFSIKKIINSIKNRQYKHEATRISTESDENLSSGLKKIMNLLNYTKTSSVSYSAGVFESGYHSFNIDGVEFRGQRNPKQRFEKLPISLEGKSVLDIGCNQGGMLYNFAYQIKHGVGVDYDSRMINVANKLRSYSKLDNLDYFVFDLENENLEYITDFLPEAKVDVVFFLSVAMWIKNWKEVIVFAKGISNGMVFESNGSVEQQDEQIAFLREVYSNVQLINEKSEDDSSQKNRKLFYCS